MPRKSYSIEERQRVKEALMTTVLQCIILKTIPIPYCSISLVIDRSCAKKETDCSLEKVAIPSK